jgi:hypothetical protein
MGTLSYTMGSRPLPSYLFFGGVRGGPSPEQCQPATSTSFIHSLTCLLDDIWRLSPDRDILGLESQSKPLVPWEEVSGLDRSAKK